MLMILLIMVLVIGVVILCVVVSIWLFFSVCGMLLRMIGIDSSSIVCWIGRNWLRIGIVISGMLMLVMFLVILLSSSVMVMLVSLNVVSFCRLEISIFLVRLKCIMEWYVVV